MNSILSVLWVCSILLVRTDTLPDPICMPGTDAINSFRWPFSWLGVVFSCTRAAIQYAENLKGSLCSSLFCFFSPLFSLVHSAFAKPNLWLDVIKQNLL